MTPIAESIVPGLAELRKRERLNRALAFAGLRHRLCGVDVCPLNPRHRLALQLLQNAFAAGAEPLEGDVFQFLWILSPAYRGRNDIASAVRQWRLRRHVRRLNLAAATREIRLYLSDQLQDMPEGHLSNTEQTDFAPWVHWMAQDACFWLTEFPGFTLETYMETPYLVLQQLLRAWKVQNPRITSGKDGAPVVEEPHFINTSDRVAGQFMRARQKEIADAIRSHRTRLS